MTQLSATHYQRHGDIAEIQLVNPPVNGLGFEVRQSLYVHLNEAMADAQVRAIVLTGAGNMFCGGADIRQFNTPKADAQPILRDVNRLIESSSKPVVAVIHGNGLGGGLELAMSCHYRIAMAGARLALPEVKLGILPGGGGTQRLPRLVGLEKALAMIVTGEAIDANEAFEHGLIDKVVTGDLLDAALSFARSVAQDGTSSRLRTTSARQVHFDSDATAYFDQQEAHIAQVFRGYPAPLECLACLKASVTMPFEEALTFERARVQHLLDGPESKALRYLFFAEREVRKFFSKPPIAAAESGNPADARQLVSRMVMAFQCEALLVWLQGATPAQVDSALQSFGMAHGCFATLDILGLEEQLASDGMPLLGDGQGAVLDLLKRLKQPVEGHGLPKTGMDGFDGADADAIAKSVAAMHQLGQDTTWPDAVIVERLLGAAKRAYVSLAGEAGDPAPAIIDWLWVKENGFPAWRGGPLHYLDRILTV